METLWNIQNLDTKQVKQLAKELGVNEIVAHLLVLRGITNYEGANKSRHGCIRWPLHEHITLYKSNPKHEMLIF